MIFYLETFFDICEVFTVYALRHQVGIKSYAVLYGQKWFQKWQVAMADLGNLDSNSRKVDILHRTNLGLSDRFILPPFKPLLPTMMMGYKIDQNAINFL